MRVVSGTYGGRPLKAVKGKNTRPTSDKIKESLFHMIGPYFEGGIGLDLYAGSGALGIEAVSRGMSRCYLVDKHPAAIKTINENVKMTKEEEKFDVWKTNDKRAIERMSKESLAFDLVLLDPPYAKQALDTVIDRLLKNNLLNDKAKIVCETDKDTKLTIELDGLKRVNEKVYGATRLLIYEWSYEND